MAETNKHEVAQVRHPLGDGDARSRCWLRHQAEEGRTTTMATTVSNQRQIVQQPSTGRAKLGYELGKEEGEAFWLLGMLETIKISGDDTAGQYGLIEIVVPMGVGSPWHTHPEEDEWFYVLEGEVTFYVGDARLDLSAGSFAFGPKGVPHTFVGASPDAARALVGFQPLQFEGFLREVGRPAPERVVPPPLDRQIDPTGRLVADGRQLAVQQLIPIAAKHGLVILGPPGPPPGR
jgi:quercetin dioxygenase-like cupin family protein